MECRSNRRPDGGAVGAGQIREAKPKMMNLYYRGYIVHEDIRSICYTIYRRSPGHIELATRSTAREAMQWVDQHVALKEEVEPGWSGQLVGR